MSNFLPASAMTLLIGTMARADLTKVPVLAVGGTMLVSVLIMAALCLALLPVLRRWFGADGPAFTSVFQGATRWQTFVALPVAGNLFGDLGLALASVAMLVMTPLLNVLCVWVLVRYASPNRPDSFAHWTGILCERGLPGPRSTRTPRTAKPELGLS